MKYRNGFVTNSSSSSFIINIKDLTPEQIRIIKNPEEEAERLGLCEYETPESWHVKTDGQRIIGWTYMDNLYGCDKLEDALKNEYVKNYYEITVELIRDGYVVAEREIDYNDFDNQGLIESLIDDDNIILLREV